MSLTPHTGQAPNGAFKIYSSSCQWGCQFYTNDEMSRDRTITDTDWIHWWIDVVYLRQVGLRWYKSYLTTIHLTLSNYQYFGLIYVSLYQKKLIHLATLGLLRQSNEGGARLPQDFGRLQLNVFNQPLSPQLMGLLGPKYIPVY